MDQNRTKVLVFYTRKEETYYPFELARSVHMAIGAAGEKLRPMNGNYGILFAEGVINTDNTIGSRGLADLSVSLLEDGTCRLSAVATDKSENIARKQVSWISSDLEVFRSCTTTEDKTCIPQKIIFSDLQADCLPDGAETGCVLELTDEQYERLEKKRKRECARGKGVRFPLKKGYADPVIFQWKNAWYLLATNEKTDNIGLYVRKASDIAGLFSETTKEHQILNQNEEKGFIKCFWAPEFHVIGGQLWILFAVSADQWKPQCYMMRLKEGGEICNTEDWEEAKLVVDQAGIPLAKDGISLDMTHFSVGGMDYLVWSYREHTGTPLDTGSMLYIAKTDVKKPWKLTSEMTLLSRPLYGWENVNGTINNEGPNALVREGKIYLAYAGGDARGYTYSTGILSADITANLLDAAAWKKQTTPALSFYSFHGVYGPGHGAFYKDEHGRDCFSFHAETDIDSRDCQIGCCQVGTDEYGSLFFS